MEPGESPFQFMMKINRSASDLNRLGDRSVRELIVIIVVGLSTDYQIEVRMLENSPRGLEKADTERVVGN